MSSEPVSMVPPSGDRDPHAGGDAPGARGAVPFHALREVSMPVSIEIGRTRLTLSEILNLRPGHVVQLDRLVGEAVDILVSDRKVAEGEVVVLGERFGVRVTRVLADEAGSRAS